MASASTASAAHAPGHAHANVRAVLERLLAGWHPTSHGVHRATLKGTGLKRVTTSTESGYADTGRGFNLVSGKWKEPTISGCTAASPPSAVLFWVGFDGFSNQTVEQDGTAAICGGGNPITYLTWWEMFPANNIQFVGTTVKPGDNIAASVVRSGTHYTLKVTDSTTAGNNVSATATCAATTCKDQSAEWIAEAPSTTVPPPMFTCWKLTNAAVRAGSHSGTIKSFPHSAIGMPGPLNPAGTSFKVC
jgi:hypothetical protein